MTARTFVADDNALRTDEYRKDAGAEQLLLRMNQALAPLERYVPSGVERPTLFIFGLPRSGTTLACQLVAQCLDLGYINNLMARFWLAPLHGIALSQAVLGPDRSSSFASDYGKTSEPNGPHEFAYFWQHWLKMNTVEDMVRFNEPAGDRDWDALGRVVRCMQDGFDRGIVFKTMYAANFIREFASAFARPLFIYIERDPVDVGISILEARKAYYGRADAWWATYPPDYFSLASEPFDRQIAGQVASLQSTYSRVLALVPDRLVLRAKYQSICEHPARFLDAIRERVADLYGDQIRLLADYPAPFKARGAAVDNDVERLAVARAIGLAVGRDVS